MDQLISLEQPAAPQTQYGYQQFNQPQGQYNQQYGQPGQGQQPQGQQSLLSGAAHPTVCIFHMGFKIAVIAIYILLSFVLSDIMTFTLVVILASMDFWMNQNITGRILVGLRWRNKINEDGSEQWIFESLPDRSQLNAVDEYIFWWSLFIYTGIWGLFLIMNILSLDIFWSVVDGVLLTLAFTNVYGYIKCKNGNFSILDWQQKIKEFGTKGIVKGAIYLQK